MSRGLRVSYTLTENDSIAVVISRATNPSSEIVKEQCSSDGSRWSSKEHHKGELHNIVFQLPHSQDGCENDAREDNGHDYHRYQNLIKRIEGGWEDKMKRLQQNETQWIRDPTLFLGRYSFDSSLQWSAHILDTTDRLLSKERNPFHRVNLLRHFHKRIEAAKRANPDYLEISCRKSMMLEIYPDFEQAAPKQQQKYHKRFQRYMNLGNVESKLGDGNPSLLLTVAPYLARDEYV